MNPSVRRRVGGAALTIVVAFAAGGCGGGQDPILHLSSAESLEIGKQLIESEKYRQAEKYLAHAFEAAPNSASGREALLLTADSLFLAGGASNLIKAETKYRDFMNRFPTTDRLPYVQLQIGNCLGARVEKPDRDQSITLEALRAYEELLRLFPASAEAAQAREKLAELYSRLAEHEYRIAFFYFRYGLSGAAVGRLEYLVEHYPSYGDMDQAYLLLGQAHVRRGNTEEAQTWFGRLRDEYPDSGLINKIPSIQVEAPAVSAVQISEPIEEEPEEGSSSSDSS